MGANMVHTYPPLTRTIWPLIHSPASLAKNPTNGATSSGCPSLSNGLCSTALFTIASNISVAIGPGATQFAVILVPFSSFARIFTIVSTAALDAAYPPNPGVRATTIDDVRQIILPPPPRFNRFAASLQHKYGPLVLTAKVLSNASMDELAIEV
ncbi:hypothetical protein Ccrd_007361 [Cynara cardunculus var. scolymus]|uniref:Uncharacterized protein n=1 Tax=Cynara cardunculus var. scolymus TaxID=59895 RepID=A0A103XH92_CYNCS|nr:hypothetical protein Ccrd_007361 [Cynara cardunculus var. scolymus]